MLFAYACVRCLTLGLPVDIINVVSVTAAAQVSHLIEGDDETEQEGLYWRQALDTRTMELSVSIIPSCQPPLTCADSPLPPDTLENLHVRYTG